MISPELLKRFPYFTCDGEGVLNEVAMLSKKVSFEPGAVIFNEGDAATTFYVVLTGRVDLHNRLGDGSDSVSETLVVGDLLGVSAMSGKADWRFGATAADAVELVAIEPIELFRICEQHPKMGYGLMMAISAALCHRLEAARVQLAARD